MLTDGRVPVSCCIETQCRDWPAWDHKLFVSIFSRAIQARVKALYFSDLPKHMWSQLRGCRAGGGDCLWCRWFVIRWGSLRLAVCCWAKHWCGKGSWIRHRPRMGLVILLILHIDFIEGLRMLLLNSQQLQIFTHFYFSLDESQKTRFNASVGFFIIVHQWLSISYETPTPKVQLIQNIIWLT